MEPDFRSDRTFLFVTLSIMLHAVLFASAAFLNTDIRSAEDIGRIKNQHRKTVISAVFREQYNTENAEYTENKNSDGPVKKLINEMEVSAVLPEISSRISENVNHIKENPLMPENRGNAGSHESFEKVIKTEGRDRLSENRGDSISENTVAETLSLSSFTTDLNPVYPKYARKKSYEGIVRVSLTVNRSGRGENIRLVKSSGYSVLDKAAMKAVKKAVFRAKNSRVYYLSAALNRALVIDINFSLTEGLKG